VLAALDDLGSCLRHCICFWLQQSADGAVAPQVAYLASTLFLDSSSDLIVLIVNTLTRDLADDNMLIGMCLITCSCLRSSCS